MSLRRAFMPQLRPIYIGCEGASEVGYVGVLNDFVRAANSPLHLIIEELGPGAGDPLARVEMAVRRIATIGRKRIAPVARFVLLDADQTERDPARAERARRLAHENDITIVWQEPCFEAVLLRHHEGRAGNRPPDTPRAQAAIAREWPGYRKPMARAEFARRIDLAALQRVATVEPELAGLLRCLGLLAPEAKNP